MGPQIAEDPCVPLPESALLRIPPRDVDEIFGCSEHGARRVGMLFRLAQRRVFRGPVDAPLLPGTKA